ncbi:phage shock protein PspA [Thalassotalea psychrophila]|uniref:Phage shock protein PspA n=1 Tax=Thalassotalea psychrophila TaxID=3065647 RepID=A0ABY9TS91_9GAMM|nr:phage shock protein PspA [Colwelliaceae bacterium SQ149]
MGMFSRLTDIINANINSLLEKAENPEKLIRLIIQEMEETLVEVRSQAAKSIAEKKTLTRKLRRLETKVTDWNNKAELALTKGREDLARSALVEKQKCEQELESLQQEMISIDEMLAGVQDDCGRLQEKLAEAKRRQESFTLRQKSAEVRLKARQTINTGNIDNAIAKFERYQQKVDEVEAQVEAYDLGKNQSLESQFAELENQDLIEEQLQQMKKKVVNG